MVAHSKSLPFANDGKPVTKKDLQVMRKSLTSTDRAALQWINNYLVCNRSLILQVRADLEVGKVQKTVEDGRVSKREKARWPDTYMTMGQIPKWYCADMLVDLCGFDQQSVDQLDNCGHNLVKEVFTFIFGVGGSAYLPRACLDKKVMRLWLSKLLSLLGDRNKGLLDRFDTRTGRIDWQKHGPFQYKWETDDAGKKHLVSITHKSTGLQDPDVLAFQCVHP